MHQDIFKVSFKIEIKFDIFLAVKYLQNPFKRADGQLLFFNYTVQLKPKTVILM